MQPCVRFTSPFETKMFSEVPSTSHPIFSGGLRCPPIAAIV
jgi:hypothetical protein